MIGHWLLSVLGGVPGTMNLLWGGFLSCLSEFTVIAAVAGGLVRLGLHFECHEPGCHRPGHVMADGHTRSCWTHHPDGKPQPGHVRRAHDRHHEQARKAAGAVSGEGGERRTVRCPACGDQAAADENGKLAVHGRNGATCVASGWTIRENG